MNILFSQTRIVPPVFIIRPPKFIVLDLGKMPSISPIVVRCIVDSFPRSKVTWHRNGQELLEGPLFNLSNITTREQQGVYSYRVDTDGFESITENFIVYIKGLSREFIIYSMKTTRNRTFLGKPLVYIQESDQPRLTFNREFECQVYSSSPILVCIKRELNTKCSCCFFFFLENQLEIK